MKVMNLMKMMYQSFITIHVFLLCLLLDEAASNFIYGKEAEQLCKEYKKTCARGKVCAVQTMMWPTMMKFPVCTHQRTEQVRSRACTLAPAPGGCGGQLRRWYYNVHMAACAWFTYGGCGGNTNNFLSREECEQTCVRGHDHLHPASTTTTTTTTTTMSGLYIEDTEESGLMVESFPDGRKYVGQELVANERKGKPAAGTRHGDEEDSGSRREDYSASRSPPHPLSHAARAHGQHSDRRLVQYVPHRLNALEMRYGRPDEVRAPPSGRHGGHKSHARGRGHQTPSEVAGHQVTPAPSPATVFVKDRLRLVKPPENVAPLSLESLTYARAPAGASDAASGRQLEPLGSSYAAGPVESVRRVPFSSDSSARGEGAEGTRRADGKRKHRDRSKKQRHRRRNRQGQKGKPAMAQHSPVQGRDNDRLEGQASDLVHRNPPTVNPDQARPHTAGDGLDARARLAEFRAGQTEYSAGQDDLRGVTGDKLSSRERQLASPDRHHKREKKRRMKGRKKEEKKDDREDSGTDIDNKYYGTIKLFKLLEKPDVAGGSSSP